MPNRYQLEELVDKILQKAGYRVDGRPRRSVPLMQDIFEYYDLEIRDIDLNTESRQSDLVYMEREIRAHSKKSERRRR